MQAITHDQGQGKDAVGAMNMPGIIDRAFYKTHWKIERFANDADLAAGKSFKTSEIDGNMLLNEGINELLLLLTGGGGTAFSNANTYIGVGDSSTAEGATQTDLQAATNKLYKAMNATYPTTGSQQIVAQSDFGSSDANYAWNEFTVCNGSSGTGKNLNRKVSSQGTKTAGQTWRVTVTITLS